MSHLLPVPWAGSRAEAKTSGQDLSKRCRGKSHSVDIGQGDPAATTGCSQDLVARGAGGYRQQTPSRTHSGVGTNRRANARLIAQRRAVKEAVLLLLLNSGIR